MEIELRSLQKTYGEEVVLRDVTVGVDDGEFCVVVGPSGCGKTTLLDCIAGLESPDGGTVRLDGEAVDGVAPGERGLGLVFQDFEERLFPHMTVAENVAFGLRQADEPFAAEEIDRRVDELLELLAIPETRDDYPEHLSGGQQQRVELARQLVRDCDTLLLDDPLSDLDYKLQKRMELELRRLQAAEGNTVVYVTHNQDQALKLADTLVVMNGGRVEQVATPDAVYHRPATAFVGRFVGDSNLLVGGPAGGGDGTVRGDPTDGDAGRVPDDGAGGDGATVRVSTDAGTVAARTEPPVDDAATGAVLVRPTDVTIGAVGNEAAEKNEAGEGTEAGERNEANAGDGGHETANGVTGELADRIYTGDRTELVVTVPGAPEEFQVVEPGDVDFDDIGAAVGDEVRLGWSPADAVYFGPDRFSVTDSFDTAELMEV
jgi:ABC-type Fe3+/spermidine/putrescine transport system ATPase subunit